jgi:hypothetical protein
MSNPVTSVTLNKQTVFGDERVSWVTVVMAGTYVSPGDTITAAQCALDVIDYIVVLGAGATVTTGSTTAYAIVPAVASGGASAALQAFGGSGSSGTALAEAAAVGNTYSVQLLVFGA